MNPYLLIVLVHIVGLTLVAGTTLIAFIANRRFWKLYPDNGQQALGIVALTKKFSVVIGIGMVLLISSGVTLMVQTHGVYAEQLWFRVKMILVLLTIVNAVVGRSLEKRVNIALAETQGSALSARALTLKSRVQVFFVVQLVLFFFIFALGVLKIN
ncbi:DUF2269 family protein [Pseudoflavitalea sp. G-6-1-2]|uniref:DUF2269 family protein n=1 Tax=Pseudoflavitalea sp. G-6-1-2 TaxID=2728841 RepID=UPI00146B285F|nr:DUF2269 family protein [Pseudoflavitalea sp. G-6-1-2]NML21863.1 DUF2269 family protein [Pseudoflavitalea sp. G-6-1-2]